MSVYWYEEANTGIPCHLLHMFDISRYWRSWFSCPLPEFIFISCSRPLSERRLFHVLHKNLEWLTCNLRNAPHAHCVYSVLISTLYLSVCASVSPSARRSVGRSVGRSVILPLLLLLIHYLRTPPPAPVTQACSLQVDVAAHLTDSMNITFQQTMYSKFCLKLW